MSLFDRLFPSRHIRTTETRYGSMEYFARDEWHGRALSKYGEWSESEVALWRKIVRPGATALDVGAHIGAHTLALASLVKSGGMVHAFEPQAKVAALLRRNTRGEPVTVHEMALGDGFNGLMSYDAPDYRRPGNFGGVELFLSDDGRGTRCDVLRFDDLHDRGWITDPIAFVKVDVEGMERDVLHGMDGMIARDRPVIYAEADRGHDRARALLTFLWTRGYGTRWHVAPLFNPDNVRGNRKNVFGKTTSVSILAMPRVKYTAWPKDPNLYRMDQIELSPEGVCLRA